MKLVRSRETFLDASQTLQHRSVGLTIGSFDAFHRGHQHLFGRLHSGLAALSTGDAAPYAVLMTFSPHPRQVLQGAKRSELEHHPDLLPVTSFRERILIAEQMGFDAFFCVRFSRAFSRMQPERFLDEFIFSPFRPRLIVIGDDWGFGRDRAGSISLLQSEAARHGASVDVVPAQCLHGERVRTSDVRAAIREGRLADVEESMGRPYAVLGRVRHGDHRGRLLGFPTANVHLTPRVLPPFGVYAVRATVRGEVLPGVANLGRRPTFRGLSPRLEVHLLRGGGDVYGQLLSVEFVEFLRPERKFSGPAELSAAIAHDCEAARHRLGL